MRLFFFFFLPFVFFSSQPTLHDGVMGSVHKAVGKEGGGFIAASDTNYSIFGEFCSFSTRGSEHPEFMTAGQLSQFVSHPRASIMADSLVTALDTRNVKRMGKEAARVGWLVPTSRGASVDVNCRPSCD